MDPKTKSGSLNEFDKNWSDRKESLYTHWTKKKIVDNQIQFAFRSHYHVFSEIVKIKAGKSLEIGCGRGSLSSYFVDNGWEVDLLDGSKKILEVAKNIFKKNNHEANFYLADAEEIPLNSNHYDLVFSIGLVEHFEKPEKVINEHIRLAKKNGWIILYIVPNKISKIQKKFNFLNKFLKVLSFSKNQKKEKEEVFRTDYDIEYYLNLIDKSKYEKKVISGIYSMPMISHSPEFPFSLLPKYCEKFLVTIFSTIIFLRNFLFKKHGWLCEEKNGNAILIAFQKK